LPLSGSVKWSPRLIRDRRHNRSGRSLKPCSPGPVPAVPASVLRDKQAGTEDRSAGPANPFASYLDLNAPQIAGAVAHAPDFRAPASHDAPHQVRPLSPIATAPALAPVSAQLDLPGDLNLSSSSFDVETIRRRVAHTTSATTNKGCPRRAVLCSSGIRLFQRNYPAL